MVANYLVLGDSASFELPLHNIWSRPETVETLDACNLVHKADVKLCKTGVSTGAGVPVGKTLRFVANSEVFADTLHRRFSECTCKSHAIINRQRIKQSMVENPKNINNKDEPERPKRHMYSTS